MNIFMVIGEELVTPSLQDTILAGITRRSVIALARERHGLKVVERPITLTEVARAVEVGTLKEVFTTSTALQIRPVSRVVDGERNIDFPEETPWTRSVARGPHRDSTRRRQRRVGMDQQGAGEGKSLNMNLLDSIKARRSVKTFTDRPVSRKEIEQLLTVACQAPNHRMTEPWRFYVLGPRARRAYGEALGHRKAKRVDDPEAGKAVVQKVAETHESLPAMIAVAITLDENPEIREEDFAAAFMGIQNLSLVAHCNRPGHAHQDGCHHGRPRRADSGRTPRGREDRRHHQHRRARRVAGWQGSAAGCATYDVGGVISAEAHLRSKRLEGIHPGRLNRGEN